MKTQEQLVQMQENLRVAMATVHQSGAPPAAIEIAALGLSSADDTLSWVLGKPSQLGRLEEEWERSLKEGHTANE